MADLSSTDILALVAASEAMRDSAKTMEFSKYTLADVRNQALNAIGGQTPKSSADPLGKLEFLDMLEDRVNNIIDAAKKRGV